MKKGIKIICILSFLLIIEGPVIGQSIHFSQFNASPLTLNPAFTGVFSGDYRAGVNYRNQWNSFTNGYKTISAYTDGSFFRKKLNNDFIGIGMLFFSDKAGDSQLGTTNASLSLSYNKALGKRKKQYISVGFQAGADQNQMDHSNLKWGNQWDGSSYDSELNSSEVPTENKTSLVVSTGLLWYFIPNKKFSVSSGIGVFNVNSPNQSFIKDGASKLHQRISLFSGCEYAITDHYSILPSAIYYKQGPNQELNIGTFIKYIISKNIEGEPSLYMGTWYRNQDAIIFVFRIDYRHYSIGFSYDVNTSSLDLASGNKGGPEISIIAIMPMPSKVKASRISCPGF